MDIFDALDDFLNESGSIPQLQVPPPELNEVTNVSQSDEVVAVSNASASQPKQIKGQKGKTKRLQKLKEILNRNETPEKVAKIVQQSKTKISQQSKAKTSPQNSFAKDLQRAIAQSIINLDSDDESSNIPVSINTNLRKETNLDYIQNEEINVKVKFNAEFLEISHRPFQKLSQLLSKVAAMKKTKEETLSLMFKNKIISGNETINSIDYVPGFVITILQGAQTELDAKLPETRDPNKIELKIQSKCRKKPFLKSINKNDKLELLVFQCAEELNADPKSIRLVFDGDTLKLQSNAEDNDLEGGEIIDCFVVEK